MKLAELFEMTVNTKSVQTDDKVKPYFDYLYAHGKHVGDQDGLEIWMYPISPSEKIFGVKQDDVLTTISLYNTKNNKVWIQHVIHTLTSYRDKQHIFKLLWFIKSQEGKQILSYGAQTADGIKFVKSLAKTGRFEVSWYNIRSNEKVPYDYEVDVPNNKPHRQDMLMTDWRILIEGDERPSFERYDTMMVKGLYCLFD